MSNITASTNSPPDLKQHAMELAAEEIKKLHPDGTIEIDGQPITPTASRRYAQRDWHAQWLKRAELEWNPAAGYDAGFEDGWKYIYTPDKQFHMWPVTNGAPHHGEKTIELGNQGMMFDPGANTGVVDKNGQITNLIGAGNNGWGRGLSRDDEVRDRVQQWLIENGHEDLVAMKPREQDEGWDAFARTANVPELPFHPAHPEHFERAKAVNKRLENLSPKSPEDYENAKPFLSPDQKTGYMLDANGDLQNVFNNGQRGGGIAAVVHAVKNGARTLDCYDGFLPRYYNQFGFQETGRIPFIDDYAPEGWDYDRLGRPDVTFMAYQGGPRHDIEQRLGQFDYQPTTQYHEDWDEAKSHSAQNVVEEQGANRASRFALGAPGSAAGLFDLDGRYLDGSGIHPLHPDWQDPAGHPAAEVALRPQPQLQFAKTAASQVMYHVTTPDRRERIMQEGLRPDAEPGEFGGGFTLLDKPATFLYDDPWAAESHRNIMGPGKSDMWRVNTDGLTLGADPSGDNAQYTHEPIHPSKVQLVSDWNPHEGTTAKTAAMQKWLYLNGKVMFHDHPWFAAHQLGIETGMNPTDAQQVANWIATGNHPRGLGVDVAMGTMLHGKPAIWFSTCDRNHVWDAVMDELNKTNRTASDDWNEFNQPGQPAPYHTDDYKWVYHIPTDRLAVWQEGDTAPWSDNQEIHHYDMMRHMGLPEEECWSPTTVPGYAYKEDGNTQCYTAQNGTDMPPQLRPRIQAEIDKRNPNMKLAADDPWAEFNDEPGEILAPDNYQWEAGGDNGRIPWLLGADNYIYIGKPGEMHADIMPPGSRPRGKNGRIICGVIAEGQVYAYDWGDPEIAAQQVPRVRDLYANHLATDNPAMEGVLPEFAGPNTEGWVTPSWD